MPVVVVILAVLALVAFLAACIQVQMPAARPVHWGWLGLALLTVVYLLTRT